VPQWNWIGLSVLAVEWAFRLGLVLRLLLRRSPGYDAISWIAVIALVPLLGSVVYLLVGETPLGRRRRRAHDRVEQRLQGLAAELLAHPETGSTCSTDTVTSSMLRLATSVGGLPALPGNDLELFDDATTVLERLRTDLDHARHHIHIMYYIAGLSPHAEAIYESLIAAAQRGVTVRFLADAVGSKAFWRSPWPERLRAAGVRVLPALPVNPLRGRLHRIDLRNHRKLTVIDSAVAWCGSQNLIDERVLVRRIPKKYMTWLDATVRLRGAAIAPLQAAFFSDWLHECDDPLDKPELYLTPPPPAGPALVHVLPSGPGERPDAIHHTFLGMLHTADREIIVTTPYFVPDTATRLALENAALRGVEVTLIVPDELDTPLVDAASRSYYEELLDTGVRIAQHQGGLLHAKTAVIDRRLAMIGSANFDRRSFWLNFELTLLVYDQAFTASLRALQQRYLAESRLIDAKRWRRRGWPERLRDNAAALLSPLL
jgi:cardiolipin synthase